VAEGVGGEKTLSFEAQAEVLGEQTMLYVNANQAMSLMAGTLLLALAGCAKKEPPPPAPPAVKVAPVTQKDTPIYIELVGSTLGS
jgi:predicted small lipoprotein YifL